MQRRLIFDFADLPQNSVARQVNATEQIGVLCGLNRRTCRRLSKTAFLILSSHPPETLLENAVFLNTTDSGWSVEFQFASHPIVLSKLVHSKSHFGSLRRAGEKLDRFQLTGTPEDGFEITFEQYLQPGFIPPRARELQQWGRIISKGDWEEAFGQLSKIYSSSRNKVQQLRDGVSIRREILENDTGQADMILSLVASKTDNAVLIINADGTVEWVNGAFENLTGFELAADVKKFAAADVLFAFAGNSPTRNFFLTSMANDHSFSFDYSFQSNSAAQDQGSNNDETRAPFWIEFQVTPVRDEHDEIVRWIAIGADVTRRRQAELAMQAARDVAESASKAKGDFLAMMSHEIRTPMNAIIGMTELTLGTQLDMEQREYLTTANNSAQSLLQILNDVLDLSKVEASRLEIEQTDFNVADLTRDTLDTLAVLAQKKSLKLHCDFPAEIPQQLVGDPVRLRQILVNLVGNAIKFTAVGEVSVRAKVTDETNDAVTLHFSVQDTGVGIAENKTSRIFEAFYQTDASVTRDFGGTGLGLAITAELIRLMGGRIWVESQLGRGSTFHFIVTLPKSNRPLTINGSRSAGILKGKTVLIVDENSSGQRLIENWLKELGAETATSRGFDEATSQIQSDEKKFDAALIISGSAATDDSDFAGPVSTFKRFGIAPILVFSSGNRKSMIERCRESGIEDYLVKPVTPRTLLVAVGNATGRKLDVSSAQFPDDAGGTVVPGSVEVNRIQPADDSLNVLIVDDHPSNRSLIAEVLRRRGHQWTEASSGSQACELIREHDFDVVLMDVQMPVIDGLQTTAEVRAMPGSKSLVPVIAVTAYVTEDDRRRCLDARMDDYLAKPVNISELLEKVERWGNTVRKELDRETSEGLAEQLQIQDVPDWATQITQTILIADEQEAPKTLANNGEDQPVDFSAALGRFGNDDGLLRMQMGFFVQETPQLMRNISTSIQGSDGKALHHNAHRLKSLIRTYDHDLGAELATNLEASGRSGSFDEAAEKYALLTACVEDLTRRIEDYLR